MRYCTTDTYDTKRGILNFCEKITKSTGKVEKKFVSDMIYGMASSGSVHISNIADSLKESTKKINTIERLCLNLEKPLSSEIKQTYLSEAMKELDENPVILVDDSDVAKPQGKAFEDLCLVRDGSSDGEKLVKGYHVTEVVGLTKKTKQPISLYSSIYSNTSEGFKSTNSVTFNALDEVIKQLGDKRATFVMDRGYDQNDMFNYMNKNEQDYIIRVKNNRNFYLNSKKSVTKAFKIGATRKGKFKEELWFQKEKRTVYVSHVNCRITASRKKVTLVIVHGLSEDEPMFLVTNKQLKSKSDVIKVLRTYMSRWRVEEYFRFKKQHFGFEDFRVRHLESINNLNTLLSFLIGFFGRLIEKKETKILTQRLLKAANPLKQDVLFYYYQLAKGICKTLALARTGIGDWFKNKIKFIEHDQLSLFDLAA